ncbi:hypothetical protein NZD89_13040 [Alicyclobacillus fastidiosus]|uniref:Uncharacterized protein n=1 Tax=Alicyclobacillus fastidiosus TaxID=392011 RepID=A0ABY6ZMP9_9BACL|nr:hypothetical protein [Alicyclobacillus fastidiosus]WAH44220.1 hypothetical protein NZD89_13040 [Alicyclobacillus fastidiosus]GMA60537.1 hypothetical protein GCM10025859_09770 [Alicyclobacillus fastidiosus]
MWNRKFEAAMIIAMGGFTTLVVGSYIHDMQSHQEDGMSRQVSQLAHRVGHWMLQHSSPDPASGTGSEVATMALPNMGSLGGSANSTTSNEGANQAPLSYADDQRLMSIAKSLSGELTQADWDAMAKAVETQDSTEAAKTVKQILWSKLSTEDQTWVQAHFQGKQAFGPEDITLVKDVIQDVQSMLTPDERTLLREQLSHLGVNIGQ